ncbi:MAG TPA: hypothetical protein VMU17_00175, partial [Elusimicrobiota bacterium]|nr:hypothetical protein [Elusimicrobiota bacterium]
MKASSYAFIGLIALAWPLGATTGAREFHGASFQDIVSSLGPDALGLNFIAERLPDVNALEASRLEGRGEKFIVEHPYTGGRWKGGKAVVEYARDLSYAIVSIYDKDGHRQRIYSVTPRAVEREKPLTVGQLAAERGETETPPEANEAPPAEAAPAVESKPAEPPPPPASSRHSKKSRKSKTQTPAQTQAPAAAPVDSSAAMAAEVAAKTNGFEWNDDVGAYVPVGGRASPASPDSVPSFPLASATRTPAASAAPSESPIAAKPPAASTAEAESAPPQTETTSGRKSKKKKRAPESTAPASDQSAPPMTVASLPKSAPPPAESWTPTPAPPSAGSGAQVVADQVPSTEELLGISNKSSSGKSSDNSIPAPAPSPSATAPPAPVVAQSAAQPAASASSEPSTTHKRSRKKRRASGTSSSSAGTDQSVPSSGPASTKAQGPANPSGDDWVPSQTALTAEKPENPEPEIKDVAAGGPGAAEARAKAA